MNKLVMHHTYAQGTAFDISNNRNHGVPINVTPGVGEFDPGFRFHSPGSRINVMPSPTLRDLGAIRARVVFHWSPRDGTAHRHNLIEGFISFALVIQRDGSLSGGIVDSDGQWRGASSKPGAVKPNAWHVADLIHDGLSRCLVYLDGVQVGAAEVRGPVRSVGELGLAIGHWPDPPDAYTFEGHIVETLLWKHDLATEIRGLLDPCCVDMSQLRTLAAQAREDGWTKRKLLAKIHDLLRLGAEATARHRAAAGQEADAAAADTADAMAAFRRKDPAAFAAATARSVARARRTIPEADIQDLVNRVAHLIGELPIDLDAVPDLARAFCWDHAVPTGIEDLIERHLQPDQTPPGNTQPDDRPTEP